MSDEIIYPKPKKTYVRNGRCTYCGSKKIKEKWGYKWCDKTCSAGRLGLKLYEETNHLGDYALDSNSTVEDSEQE